MSEDVFTGIDKHFFFILVCFIYFYDNTNIFETVVIIKHFKL